MHEERELRSARRLLSWSGILCLMGCPMALLLCLGIHFALVSPADVQEYDLDIGPVGAVVIYGIRPAAPVLGLAAFVMGVLAIWMCERIGGPFRELPGIATPSDAPHKSP